MGNTVPSSPPPQNGQGQAVLYLKGFEYHGGGECQCSVAEVELLSSNLGPLNPAAAMPPELAGTSVVTLQDFAAGAARLNGVARRYKLKGKIFG
eukprot:SAG31_NODE_9044_length_1343_cov_2.317524_1_plen_93_part_01